MLKTLKTDDLPVLYGIGDSLKNKGIKSKIKLKKNKFFLFIDLFENDEFYCAVELKISVSKEKIRICFLKMSDLTYELNSKMQAPNDNYTMLTDSVFAALHEFAKLNTALHKVVFNNEKLTATIRYQIPDKLSEEFFDESVQHLVTVMSTIDALTPQILVRSKEILVVKKTSIYAEFIATHDATLEVKSAMAA